ncbi:MAG: hypothetical protein BYD32DRAFT_306425 [Podila humilis]|nr:MAG: hypothetical protein BYD32DRAFT_306425 [Podila humilis]
MASCIPRVVPYLFLFFGLLAISVASPILSPHSLGTIERRTEGCPAAVNTCKDHCDSIGQGGGSCGGPLCTSAIAAHEWPSSLFRWRTNAHTHTCAHFLILLRLDLSPLSYGHSQKHQVFQYRSQ